jgi:hypothetical protein
MRTLLLAVLATSLAAAGAPTMEWLPLPATIAWHGDKGAPQGAGLIGRALAIVVVDWDRSDGATGQNTFWSLRWWWTAGGRAIDFRQGGMMLSVGGNLPHQDEDKPERFLKGEDNSGGLLRALGGDATAVVLLVNPEGRVTQLFRCTDANSFRNQFDQLVPKEDRGLVVNDSSYPVACRPAFDLLKSAEVKGALTLCTRKLGADGVALAKDIAARADVLITGELALLGDASVPASQRFIARGRIDDLLAAFPGSSKAGQVAKVVKGLKGDKAYAAEEAGWAALQDYLTQAGKAQPKKLAQLQQQQLNGISTRHAGTYAAELAGLIRTTARVEP